MGSKMLIDAAHPEETRVVVVRGNRVEDFDYESATRKQLRGNIYLAKVTRVEPSLQAAFVDYGGNRHGFLAFNEIHPDYYQIPVADRKALLEEEAEEESRARDEEDADDNGGSRRRRKGRRGRKSEDGEALEAAEAPESVSEDAAAEPGGDDKQDGGTEAADASPDDDAGDPGKSVNGASDSVESVGSEDALEELPARARRRKRNYKIQEVIKRRQIILIQVVKEERGNKGAALTTYLSLAGRYTVMMPNTARGGGISRKITNASDRKKLRKIAGELEVADGMGLIIRTAGAARTKTEIKRDFEYLLRLWENIRDLTLNSTAPALVYEEGNLIKRSIRDLYNKDIDAISVSGDEAYKEAKGFMRMLMPSHAKNVQPYKEPEPLFLKHKIERQLSAMYSPYVTLKSGGYIVINQTEALVSIDVNSGKSTREHSIEDTALKTNLEAAEEASRQLRLRDLAGLIVIDFIDMEERRNNRSVERKLKDCLRHDRARIQIGRISHFGLMEMSRQRLRAGMLEGSTHPCEICQGTGIVRSTESVSLDILRTLEDTLLTNGPSNLRADTSADAALYILNYKRAMLRDIETRYGISILIEADPEQHGSAFTIEKTAAFIPRSDDAVVKIDSALMETDMIGDDEPAAESAGEADGENEQDGDAGRKRSRRRRRRGGRGRGRGDSDGEMAAMNDGGDSAAGDHADSNDDAGDTQAADARHAGDDGEDGQERKSRRRGRRGGRRSRAARSGEEQSAPRDANGDASAQEPEAAPQNAPETNGDGDEKPEPLAAGNAGEDQSVDDATDSGPAKGSRRASRARASARTTAKDDAEAPAAEQATDETAEAAHAVPNGNGKDEPGKAAAPESSGDDGDSDDPRVIVDGVEAEAQENAPRRSGWWQRRA